MTRTKARHGAKRAKPVQSTCPCGKQGFASEGDATHAIAQARGFAGQRAYRCPYADVWHTTSQRPTRHRITLSDAERDLVHELRRLAEIRQRPKSEQRTEAWNAAYQKFQKTLTNTLTPEADQ